ncbi:Panacea domain-containing protein [Stenotrophomonas sepilia]|uniref:Panacea domain-containing protein n=1 Tax=Stenotrophomonas sepilia TaxID=2860290 RepID=UPI0035586574
MRAGWFAVSFDLDKFRLGGVTMSYSAAHIANKFLQIAAAEGRSITPMQLQKLVYIAHGWHLGHTGQPLINEDVQAWRYGPVIYDLYNKTKAFGNQPITEWIPTGHMPWQRDVEVDANTGGFIADIWRHYSQYDAVQLSNMTHSPNTPWYRRWVDNGGSSQYFAVIDNDDIARFYSDAVRMNQIPSSA